MPDDDDTDEVPVVHDTTYIDPTDDTYDYDDTGPIREGDIEIRKANPQTGRMDRHISDFYNAFLLIGAMSIGIMSGFKYKLKSKRIYISKKY